MAVTSSASHSLETEVALSIQSFHQCSSLISIKLSPTNYILWKSQVLPLVRSLGIEHHLFDDNPPDSKVVDKEGKTIDNSLSNTWLTNDGLITSWLLGIITEEVLAMIEGLETAHQVWNSLEETLLTITKENEIHISESLHSLKKGNMSIEEYVKKFKFLCDKHAAMKKPIDDLSKVFTLARGLRPTYKDFRTAMLSKALII